MTMLLNLVAVARWRATELFVAREGLSATIAGMLFAGVLPLITGRNSKDPL